MALPSGSYGVRWRGREELDTKMTLFAKAFQRGLVPIVDDLSDEIQQYAQENAPWEDRTGDARDGLQTNVRYRELFYYIDLYHTVEYGIWLEIRWNGRFAIIQPTLEHYGPIVMESLDMGEILHHGY